MEGKETKIGFFKRLKKAIFELEDYGFFLGERVTVAFKYFFLLLFMVSLIFSLVVTYKSSNVINKAYSYITDELPEFDFKDNMLNFDENIDAYDHDYQFTLLADTTENLSEEKINEYKNKVYSQGNYGIIFLKDKVVLIADNTEDVTKYEDYIININNVEAVTGKEISISNKQDVVSLLEQVGFLNIVLSVFVIILGSSYLANLFIVFSDICVVAVFGWFAARLCGVNFKINPMLAISIYSLSLSIVLDLILDIIYVMTGFSVQYFEIIYLLIAYVYIVAAIFMVKYDLVQHTEELKKILEVQKQVERELAQKNLEKNEEKEKQEEKSEDKMDDNKLDEKTEENRDPDGSEI